LAASGVQVIATFVTLAEMVPLPLVTAQLCVASASGTMLTA
jgi:hypothetical protein